jgi:hypothetical protein
MGGGGGRTTIVSIERFHAYVGMLIIFWLFLFPIFLSAAPAKECFLDGLKKLEQRSHKCWELRGNM